MTAQHGLMKKIMLGTLVIATGLMGLVLGVSQRGGRGGSNQQDPNLPENPTAVGIALVGAFRVGVAAGAVAGACSAGAASSGLGPGGGSAGHGPARKCAVAAPAAGGIALVGTFGVHGAAIAVARARGAGGAGSYAGPGGGTAGRGPV